MALDFELRNFRRLRGKGMRAYRKGRWGESRQALLRAAECLYRIADRSEEPFRGERCRQAAELHELARGIRDRAPAEPARAERADSTGWELLERPDVTFDSVAGLADVKEEIRLRMVYPFSHPEAAKRYGIRPGGGLLLFGPPGTGKTLLARAVAGEIDAAFFAVRPSDLLSKWVGEAEKNVARLFEEARARERGVIFLDEIEALAPARTGDGTSVMSRVVPQLLGELEGVHGRGEGAVLFIGATNAPWDLDPAILRPGRFDVKVYVGLPDREAREVILENHLGGRPLAEDVDLEKAAALFRGYSGADLRRVAEKALGESFLFEVREGGAGEVTMEDLLRVAGRVRPSVSAEQIGRYREWGGE